MVYTNQAIKKYQSMKLHFFTLEIRDFGYVDNIVVLGLNVHDVTLL